MAPGAPGVLTAKVISRFSSPRTQGIQQQPTTTKTVTATIPAMGTDWIRPIHPWKVSLMPEFSANSNLSICSPASGLANDQSGAVLSGIKVHHVVPIILHTPPSSANNISKASLLS